MRLLHGQWGKTQGRVSGELVSVFWAHPTSETLAQGSIMRLKQAGLALGWVIRRRWGRDSEGAHF